MMEIRRESAKKAWFLRVPPSQKMYPRARQPPRRYLHLYMPCLTLTRKFLHFLLKNSCCLVINSSFLVLTCLTFFSNKIDAEGTAARVPPPLASLAVKMNPKKEAASETPMVEVLEKIAADAKIKRRKKNTKAAPASLEAHQATSSLSDVSILFAQAS
jgi:hypothetical protein